MFDEISDKPVVPPVNTRPLGAAPKPAAAPIARVEDIFSEVDKTGKPEVFRPRPGDSNPPRGVVVPPEMDWRNNKKIAFSLLFGGLIVVAVIGYFGFKLAAGLNPAADNAAVQEPPKNTAVGTPTPMPTAEANETVLPSTPPAVVAPLDSDLDGLTDEEEAKISTDPNSADTDQDGLTDREEAKVYLTNPLEPDTDGDGFRDGDEVRNGYNPKGSGKLLEIK